MVKDLTVVCVLKSGGEYTTKHVAALAEHTHAFLKRPHRFLCLTDRVKDVKDKGIDAAPLVRDWAGWWSKICLFAPDVITGPAFYMDLDVRPVGQLDDIVLGHSFTMCDDFLSHGNYNSSVMAWDEDLSSIFYDFDRHPGKYMQEYRKRGKWGDQDFITHHSPVVPERMQEIHPGSVVSYKADVVKRGSVPPDTRIVAFHGKPKPWKVGW